MTIIILIQSYGKQFILFGDINIHILGISLSNVLENNGFLLPRIKDIATRTTRRTANNNTLMDHIYCDSINILCTSGVPKVDITDYKPVYILKDVKDKDPPLTGFNFANKKI